MPRPDQNRGNERIGAATVIANTRPRHPPAATSTPPAARRRIPRGAVAIAGPSLQHRFGPVIAISSRQVYSEWGVRRRPSPRPCGPPLSRTSGEGGWGGEGESALPQLPPPLPRRV